jgi:hypothetical protein
MGTINLKLGIMCFSKWMNDFNLYASVDTRTNMDTTYGVATEILEATNALWDCKRGGYTTFIGRTHKKHSFGHYAHILVDIDLSGSVYDEIMVKRDGFVVMLEMVNERLPNFCSRCRVIGHNISALSGSTKWKTKMKIVASKWLERLPLD